jgi:hypothetical protein
MGMILTWQDVGEKKFVRNSDQRYPEIDAPFDVIQKYLAMSI